MLGTVRYFRSTAFIVGDDGKEIYCPDYVLDGAVFSPGDRVEIEIIGKHREDAEDRWRATSIQRA
jgi:hypothetical protein